MIGIRADANAEIASGHIMRCIAIAEQFQNYEDQVIFITSDHYPDTLLDEKGYKHICLGSNWMDKSSELDDLMKYICEMNIEILLVDSYEVNSNYLETLKKVVKLVYIDDLYLFQYPVDMIINYALAAKKEEYQSYPSTIEFLIGPKYTPLRKEFQNSIIQVNQEVKHVLITTGGSDNFHLTLGLINKVITLGELSKVCFHIIVGRFFCIEDIEEMKNISIKNTNIIIHNRVENMAKIMKQCDIAISAGGTTLAELCACGVPTICFAIANNQLQGVRMFGEKEIMLSLGDVRDDLKLGIDRIIKQMIELKNNSNTRALFSIKGTQVIDGNGARRIAERMLQL